MSEAARLNFKVDVPGKEKNRGNNFKIVTLKSLTNWILSQSFDDETAQGLIALASKYPNSALPNFRKNINMMIARVRGGMQKQEEVINEHEKTSIDETKKQDIEKPSIDL